MNAPATERPVSAAVRLDDGRVFTGAIHVLAWEAAGGYVDCPAACDWGCGYCEPREGFVTNTGRYVGRMEARRLIDGGGRYKLTSEELNERTA